MDLHGDLVCRACGVGTPSAELGARCAEHPDSVMVSARALEHAGDDAVVGTLIDDRYAVVALIGRGGFGSVYRAVQLPMRRVVAVKVVHAEAAQDEEARGRFFREAKICAQLKAKTTVTLCDFGEHEGVGLFSVFEFIRGRSLQRMLRNGPQDVVWTSNIVLNVLRSLSEAHQFGLVHRDIKPANIMVQDIEPRGQQKVRLLDFGLAKYLDPATDPDGVRTRKGIFLGTPAFMSPEQIKQSPQLDGRSDLYSLALVAYTMIAGANPMKRASLAETMMAQLKEEPPPFEPELMVPKALERALFEGLQKKPEDRYASADAMAEAVRSALPLQRFTSVIPAPRAPSTDFDELVAEEPSVEQAKASPIPITPNVELQVVVPKEEPATDAMELPWVSETSDDLREGAGWPATAGVRRGTRRRRYLIPLLLMLIGVALAGGWFFGIHRPAAATTQVASPSVEPSVDSAPTPTPSTSVAKTPPAPSPAEVEAPQREPAAPSPAVRRADTTPTRAARRVVRRRKTETTPAAKASVEPVPAPKKANEASRLVVPEF